MLVLTDTTGMKRYMGRRGGSDRFDGHGMWNLSSRASN